MWPRWINAVLGLWLILAPFVWGYGRAFGDQVARQNEMWVGIFVLLAALVSYAVGWLRYVNTAFGVWLVAAPFALGYVSQAAVWNSVLVGIAVAIVSLIPHRKGASDRPFSRRRTATV